MVAFHYEQIRALVNRLMVQHKVFESLFIGVHTLKTTLSILNQTLLLSVVPCQDRVRSRWERDLGLVFTSRQWNRIRGFNLYFSVNTATQENRYKVINRWHFTPKLLAKMNPQLGD